MKILVIGSNGMVGNVVALWMKEHGHTVEGYDEQKNEKIPTIIGTLHNEKLLCDVIRNGDYNAVIYCAAIINQEAESDRANAVYVNSYLPHLIEKITSDMNTVLVYRGTDCVFSGKRGAYTVNDVPDAESFYAKTKMIGAIINKKDITIRTSLIGPETVSSGTGLFNWFMMQTGEVGGYKNAIWTGVTTIEFAREIDYLLSHNCHGLFQCVPQKAISKYELLCLFKDYFDIDKKIIGIENEHIDKSLIPNISVSGLQIPEYDKMMQDMKEWITKHIDIYKHYIRSVKR